MPLFLPLIRRHIRHDISSLTRTPACCFHTLMLYYWFRRCWYAASLFAIRRLFFRHCHAFFHFSFRLSCRFISMLIHAADAAMLISYCHDDIDYDWLLSFRRCHYAIDIADIFFHASFFSLISMLLRHYYAIVFSMPFSLPDYYVFLFTLLLMLSLLPCLPYAAVAAVSLLDAASFAISLMLSLIFAATFFSFFSAAFFDYFRLRFSLFFFRFSPFSSPPLIISFSLLRLLPLRRAADITLRFCLPLIAFSLLRFDATPIFAILSSFIFRLFSPPCFFAWLAPADIFTYFHYFAIIAFALSCSLFSLMIHYFHTLLPRSAYNISRHFDYCHLPLLLMPLHYYYAFAFHTLSLIFADIADADAAMPRHA